MAQLSDFLGTKEYYQDADACESYCYDLDIILGTPSYKDWDKYKIEMFNKKIELDKKEYDADEPKRKLAEFQNQLKEWEK